MSTGAASLASRCFGTRCLSTLTVIAALVVKATFPRRWSASVSLRHGSSGSLLLPQIANSELLTAGNPTV